MIDQVATHRLRRMVIAWAVAMAVIWTAATVVSHSRLVSPRTVSGDTSPTVNALSSWDGTHYATVAENGYSAKGVERRHLAFFPLLPALARLVGGRDHVRIAGVLLSQVCFLVALLVLVRLWPLRESSADVPLRREPGFWLLVSPLAFFLSVFYTESLFLLLIVLTYLGLRKRSWGLSGTTGFLAGLCRPTSVFLVALYWGEAFSSWRSGRRWKPPFLSSIAPILGVALYFGFVGYLTGDPFGYFDVQAGTWDQSWTVPFLPVVRDSVDILVDLAHARWPLPDQTVRIFSAVGILLLFAWGARKLEPSLLLFLAVSLLVIHSQEPHRSTARYELVLFPVYFLLPRTPLARRHVAPIVCAALAIIQLVMLVRFLTWEWVA